MVERARERHVHTLILGRHLKSELNNIADSMDFGFGEVKRKPEVTSVLDVLVTGLTVGGWQGKLPGLEVTGVVVRSEDLHGDSPLLALVGESVGLVPVPALQVELEGVAHAVGSLELEGDSDPVQLAQPPLGDGVVVPVLLVPALQQGELRLDDRGGDLVHPQGVVRGLELELLEELEVLGGRKVALVQVLVGAGDQDGPDGDLLVVGHQEPALARVDELVGLGGEAGGDGSVLGASALDAVPVAPKAVGAVLDEGDVVLLADLGDSGHVAQPSPHVGHDRDLGAGFLGLPLEVLDVDHELAGAVDVLGLAPGVHDRARDGGEGEGVGQDLGRARDLAEPLFLLLEHGVHGQEDRRAARVEGHAVLVPGDVREGPLHEGHVVHGLVWVVGARGETPVPEHLSGLHDLPTPLDSLLRDWARGLDVDGESWLLRVLVEHRQLPLADDLLGLLHAALLRDPGHEHRGEPGVLLGAAEGETELVLLLGHLELATILVQLGSTKSRHVD
mmetsp:Transcript_13688/g.38561  ORF Transcript_13688/g.38561 Transcript_13688/m.38561 type:complete len:504 (-) Transcript_13688:211-1722(-)